MLERIDSRELTEWMAYAQVEPFGEERADLRAGIVASTIANVWRSSGQKVLKPSDFMPKFEPQRQLTNDELAAVFKGSALAFGGKVIEKSNGHNIGR